MNLFFHQAALGDFVLTFPILRSLAALPGQLIVVAPWSKAVLAQTTLPDTRSMDIELWEFIRLHSESGPTHISPAVNELFTGARRIISFLSNGNDTWSTNVKRLSPRAQRLFVYPRPPQDFTGHVVDWHDLQLREQGLELCTAPICTSGHSNGPVVIHPGSGGLPKCWAIDRFETLIEQLRAQGQNIQPILGEVEVENWSKQTLQRWQTHHGAKVPSTTLQLLELLHSASAFIGVDSGPTHLAAQIGTPTLTLFGPTDPARWAPIGPRVQILAPPDPCSMDWLAVDQVLESITQLKQGHVDIVD